MAVSKHILRFSSINAFFQNDNGIIRKGENALESGLVKKMDFDPDLMILRGEILASMKNKSYLVSIELAKNADISSATCTCPRGIKCLHIAALALCGHFVGTTTIL